VQAGPYFRSLCSRCNLLLGINYDPALADFCLQVRALANRVLALPIVAKLEIQPQAVMRSVLGHMAAQGLNGYEKGPITEPLRDYVLGETASLPEQIGVYYWLYPFRAQVLLKNVAIARLGTGQNPVVFWLMKFFPLAFFIAINEPISMKLPGGCLNAYRNVPADAKHEVNLILQPITHPMWPEHPTDDAALLMHSESGLLATSKSIRNKS
jgi:hypothetical protein